MSETKEPQEAREFWIYRNEEYTPTYACDFNQRGFVPSRNRESIHVIEYSEYENLQKENAILREALVRHEAAKNDAIRYCHPNSDIFWAAKIIGILLNCDFRDSQEEAKGYLEKVKSEKAEGE